jgi:hypothetical protein
MKMVKKLQEKKRKEGDQIFQIFKGPPPSLLFSQPSCYDSKSNQNHTNKWEQSGC